MQKRSAFRTKVVLPVTLFLKNGTQKQAAHTLDLTSDSARIGGLYLPVKPGEIVEVQRGATRGKFFVFWVGAPGTMMAGQIGTRMLTAGKSIWSVDLPGDRPDRVLDVRRLRSGVPLVHCAGTAEEARQMQATAYVRAEGYPHPIFAQVLEISESCAILETTAAVPVDTSVTLKMSVGLHAFELRGIVQVSDPDWGMGIQFPVVPADIREKLIQAKLILQRPTLAIAEPKPVASTTVYW